MRDVLGGPDHPNSTNVPERTVHMAALGMNFRVVPDVVFGLIWFLPRTGDSHWRARGVADAMYRLRHYVHGHHEWRRRANHRYDAGTDAYAVTVAPGGPLGVHRPAGRRVPRSWPVRRGVVVIIVIR